MEEKNMNDSTPPSSASKNLMIIGIALVAIIIAIGAYFIYQDYQETEPIDDETAEEIENDSDESENEETSTLEKEFDRVLALISTLRVELEEEFFEDLDLIEEYIVDNPEVLLEDDPTASVPEEVEEAYERIKDAIDASYANSETPNDEVLVGNRYVVEGTLEVAEDKDSSLGTVYMMEVDELNLPLYFVFGGDLADEVSETMVGEMVEVEVEITEINEGTVSYKVTDGPSLVDADDEGVDDDEIPETSE